MLDIDSQKQKAQDFLELQRASSIFILPMHGMLQVQKYLN